MIDTLVKGGLIVDGTGRAAFPGDVAIEGGRIVGLGTLGDVAATRTIDATGRVVSPGFIDPHTHTDHTILTNAGALSSVVQGITTEVFTNCGMAMAPQNDARREAVTRLAIERVAGRDEAQKADLSWNSTAGFLDTLDQMGIGINVATMVGQGTVRGYVMGDKLGPASPDELAAMKALVAQGMDDGAWGLSTGRNLSPGCYAATDEVVELGKVAAAFGGSHFCHVGALPTPGTTIKAIQESVDIAKRSGLHLQVAHLGSSTSGWESNFRPGTIAESVRGRALDALELLDREAKAGMPLHIDCYPYNFSGARNPFDIMPQEIAMIDRPKALEMLGTQECRDWLRVELAKPESGRGMSHLEWILVSFVVACPSKREIEGRCLWDMAVEQGKDPLDYICDLLLETGGDVVASAENIHEPNLQAIYRHPLTMPSSDGWAIDRPLPPPRVAHPRHAGSMVRFLGRYWREQKLFSLEEAIRKMTSLPAQSIGLKHRSQLAVGNWADVVVFDPDTVADRATFLDPYLRPVGIDYVLVNGQVAVEGGKPTGVRAGHSLRRGQA